MIKNLWFLTEERPKNEVLITILRKFATDNKLAVFIDKLRILPILDNGKFTFAYEVVGFNCSKVNKLYIKTVSGTSSFVDFLIFYQSNEPISTDKPIYAIEETKTDDKESRNTGVFQRCTKFVQICNIYPDVKKVMLYNLQISQKDKPTDTYILGTRLLITMGVEIIGKKLDSDIFIPFNTISEIIEFKKKMRKAPKGNVPISISKSQKTITLTGRLVKNGRLSHDPNIGALSIISFVIRQLGWKDKILIKEHGLIQENIGNTNKFIQIANQLNISLHKIKVPIIQQNIVYWKYDMQGEKLGTIFIHIVVENFTSGYSIFENHAGSEKGYFYPLEGEPIPLEKYKDREKYKAGDKEQINHIPDLILIDIENTEIINIEGKKYEFLKNGVSDLKNYDYIEKYYINNYYKKFKIIRTVVLFGSDNEQIMEVEIGFLLNKNGKLILGIKAPKIFKLAIKNLLDYWK